jgi:hypothetical protein
LTTELLTSKHFIPPPHLSLLPRPRLSFPARLAAAFRQVNEKISALLRSILQFPQFLFGYISDEKPSPQPENAFRFLISGFPLVFTFIAWLLASKLSFKTTGIATPGK